MGFLLRDGEIMSEPVHTVEIDRIRLTGLEVMPEHAERIRAMVEGELQRLLERGSWPEGMVGGEVTRLEAPTMHMDRPHSESHLASGVARSIVRTLPGVERSEESVNARI